MQRLILLLALVLAALASPALAQDFPARPDGPVYDAADLLPARLHGDTAPIKARRLSTADGVR